MSPAARPAVCLEPSEARAALKALSWFILRGPDALLGPDGEALLAARAKLAAGSSDGPGLSRA